MRTIENIIVTYSSLRIEHKIKFIEELQDEELDIFIVHCKVNSIPPVTRQTGLKGTLKILMSEYDKRKQKRRDIKLNDLGI